MPRPRATCEVWINGAPVADTPAEYLADQPTVLAPLTLTWGRDSLLVQPDTATCTFAIQSRTRQNGVPMSVLDVARIGAEVDVYAEGATGIDDDVEMVETVDDGTFTLMPQPVLRVVNRITNENPYFVRFQWFTDPTDGHGQRVVEDYWWLSGADPVSPGWALYVPPAAFSGIPTAWDDIPQIDPDEFHTWEWSIRVKGPPGATLIVQPVAFNSLFPPNGTPEYPNPIYLPGGRSARATGEWQTFTNSIDPSALGDQRGNWVGLDVYTERDAAGWSAEPWADGAGSWADYKPGTSWAADWSTQVDDVSILAPRSARTRALVFSGRITDLDGAYVDGATVVQVTAADLAAELANVVVGDEPWPMERADDRQKRIVNLVPASVRPVWPTNVDSWAPQRVGWRDVDAQPVWGLLQDVSQSVGQVLWCATHISRGPYLYPENPEYRVPLSRWAQGATGATVTVNGATAPLSACDVLRDPITWSQGVADAVTRVDVTWQEQTTDDDGHPAPTERHVLVVDPDAEALYGQRRASVTTELADQADAADLAADVLRYSHTVQWSIAGVTIDVGRLDDDVPNIDDGTRQETLLALLGGTARLGLPLTVQDLPEGTPGAPTLAAYVEGGRYTFDQEWTLELNLSPGAYQGSDRFATWESMLPAWSWATTDPALTWNDGWAAPPA